MDNEPKAQPDPYEQTPGYGDTIKDFVNGSELGGTALAGISPELSGLPEVWLDERQQIIFDVPPQREDYETDSEIAVDHYNKLLDPNYVDARTPEQAIEEAAVREPKVAARFVTDESLADSVNLFSDTIDPTIQAIVSKFLPGKNGRDAVDGIRTNRALRYGLAQYFLTKIDMNEHNMPGRVLNDQGKTPNFVGYADAKMTGREYAALLAISKLDGTFKKDRETNELDRNPDGSYKTGHHRTAADMILQ
jgi:hypothetical protein